MYVIFLMHVEFELYFVIQLRLSHQLFATIYNKIM